jgi:hypothetical protein
LTQIFLIQLVQCVHFIRSNNLSWLIRSGVGRLKNDIARDLRDLFIQHGYVNDQRGNFIKPGGVIISGGLEFNDLITPQEYIRFIQSVNMVQINQSDLTKLNFSLNTLLINLENRRWNSFPLFVEDVSRYFDISVPVVQLASLLIRLPHENNLVYIAILKGIGDVKVYRRMEDRLQAIYGYFRQKIQAIPRSYNRHETLDEDQIDKEKIRMLLNFVEVSDTHLDFLTKLIQLYPDMYDCVKNYSGEKNTFVYGLIRLYYTEVPDMVQELYTYAVNYPYIFPESPEKISRRQQISELPRSYLASLYLIYSSQAIESILDMPQHPLELYLFVIAKAKADQLIPLVANFGMVIPEHLLIRNRRHYVLQNISQYKKIITRPPDTPPIDQVITSQPKDRRDFVKLLGKYSDQEIISHFSHLGGFEHRENLIEQIYATISEEGFMVQKELNTKIVINNVTTLLTEIKDIPKPYLVFGTPFRYRILELEEITEAFYMDKGGFKFMKIGNGFDETYTISQVSRLQTLLPAMKNMNPQLTVMVEQLLTKIQSGIISTLKRNSEVDSLIKDVKRTSTGIQSIIKEILYKLFYAGMYMRKWKGPGSRFPLASSTTHGGSKEAKAIFTLGEVLELMNKLPSNLNNRVRTIPEIDYPTKNNDITIKSHTYLFNLVDKVIKGDQCIRMASRPIVISANYYIGVMFEEVIPDFDPHSVDHIS